MSFFVKSTPAPQPKTQNVRSISLLLATVLVVMVVTQLFTFEDFPEVIAKMNLPGGEVFADLRAALIVIAEVAALPFLFLMRLSPAARTVSMVAGWMAAAGWTFSSFWTNIALDHMVNSGFLGATASLPSGWWTVFFSLALGVLVVWASWGNWPVRHKRTN